MGLTEKAKNLLRSFPENYLAVAEDAMRRGKAFCPSCHFAGMSNCGHFDECGAFIMPDGRTVEEIGPEAP